MSIEVTVLTSVCHGLELAVSFAILAALHHFAVGQRAKFEAEGSR
jgi:Flp pilus assembly protein TadG